MSLSIFTAKTTEQLKDFFVNLNALSEPELQNEIRVNGKAINANKGDILIRKGQRLDFLPIVITGSIRVYHIKTLIRSSKPQHL